MTETRNPLLATAMRLRVWLDVGSAEVDTTDGRKIDIVRMIPFIALHLLALSAPLFGVSTVAVVVCIALYLIRMFAITGFYHRCFSHRSVIAPRFVEFIFAFIGNASAQRGPLWWAAHHRRHHSKSDRDGDAHSPHVDGMLGSHLLWIGRRENFATDHRLVKDLAARAELRFLDRFPTVAPLSLAIALYIAGSWLAASHPELGTSGWQLVAWGFGLSTVLLFHATSAVNSIAHLWGSRRYVTKDDSRNNALVALLTLGEGWHNNHHYYPASARQGFYWWEIDLTYYVLKAMQAVGLVHRLRPVPAAVRDAKGHG